MRTNALSRNAARPISATAARKTATIPNAYARPRSGSRSAAKIPDAGDQSVVLPHKALKAFRITATSIASWIKAPCTGAR